MTLPPIRDGLAMLLTDFTIAQRAAVQTRFWTVFSDHNDAFLTGARDANKKTPRRATSAERLAADLARQAEAGAAAELWVGPYERERLSGHPLQDQIRRVSEDDEIGRASCRARVCPYVEIQVVGAHIKKKK